MNPKYKEWIDANYPTMQSALGMCRPAVIAMKEAFPELQVTNGFAHFDSFTDPRMHWWLKTEDGTIVDPTAIQYPEYIGCPISRYEEIDDTHPARRFRQTKCPNCGEYYYDTPELQKYGPCCSQACVSGYTDYLNGK